MLVIVLLSAMLWFHPLPCACAAESSEQLQFCWEWYWFPKLSPGMFALVTWTLGIAVKLWFCFWWGAGTGNSARVAFTVLICEHNNVDISVSGLFQLPCVRMISGINFDLLFVCFVVFFPLLFHVGDLCRLYSCTLFPTLMWVRTQVSILTARNVS